MLIVIAFALAAVGQSGNKPVPAAGGIERAADAQDKQICKRFVETGSLVRGYRVCKTKREWERSRDDIRSRSGAGSASCRDGANGGAGCGS